MAKISQREARQLKKRVAELEDILRRQRLQWAREWPGGTHLDTMTVKSEEFYVVKTARLLGHAVVVVPSEYPKLQVYGCALPK